MGMSRVSNFKARAALLVVRLLVTLLVLALSACGGAGGQEEPNKGQSHISVSSSIPDGAKLRGALRWTAKPESDADSQVAKVDFLIDGKREWTEENTPFFFKDDKQLLATWLLEPGQHTLAVRRDDRREDRPIGGAGHRERPPDGSGCLSRHLRTARHPR